MITSSDSWSPIGVDGLEPEALSALREVGHTCVIAGPGSGKTELLAQKAAFLFQTGHCPSPYRILAISFKKDSAENLAERVERRCGRTQASRFDSMTFDAFTKSLLDRFRLLLPDVWRPTPDYRVSSRSRSDFRAFISKLSKYRPQWREELEVLSFESFEQELLGNFYLPFSPEPAKTARECAALNWVSSCITSGPSSLPFAVINRLAELILRNSTEVRRALIGTYPYVFIDEFQDTTHSQYNLLLTVLGDRSPRVTAVGDDKQRIMLWAGANPNAFAQFMTELEVAPHELKFNYRSSQALVELQHVVAKAINPDTPTISSRNMSETSPESAQVWTFKQNQTEYSKVANFIEKDHKERSVGLSGYAILVRQKAEDFETKLAPHLAAKGIKLINHSKYAATISLQDLLKDDLTRLNLRFLKLATAEAHPQIWDEVRSSMLYIRQVDADDDELAYLNLENEIQEQVETLRHLLVDLPVEQESAEAIGEHLRNMVPDLQWRRGYRNYQEADNLTRSRQAFIARLQQVTHTASSWKTAVSDFGGDDSIPIMTFHKSKGLEFHTVICLALDDNTWWSYKGNPQEGDSTFFVGLSRARNQIIFTYCSERGRRSEISDLFGYLEQAGVPEYSFD